MCTWYVFGPADVQHEFSVGEVTQRRQSFDVTVREGGVGHGTHPLWLRLQQEIHHLILILTAAGGYGRNTRKELTHLPAKKMILFKSRCSHMVSCDVVVHRGKRWNWSRFSCISDVLLAPYPNAHLHTQKT